MEEKLINIIYDLIKDYNFYNHDNDIDLKNVKIIKDNECILIELDTELYNISANKIL